MSTIALTAIYDQTMPELPRCPRALIMKHFRNVLIEWCHESMAWTYDLTAINIVADKADYRLDGRQPSYATIDSIPNEGVYLDGVLQRPGVQYTLADRELMIHLTSTPSDAITAGLQVQVALRPTRTATMIDKRLYEDWEEQWAKGVMAKLMRMPKKAWTDGATATSYWKEYRNSIAEARIQQSRGGMSQAIQARARSPHRWR